MNDQNNQNNQPQEASTHGGGAQEGTQPGFNDLIKSMGKGKSEKPGLLDNLNPVTNVVDTTKPPSGMDLGKQAYEQMTGKPYARSGGTK